MKDFPRIASPAARFSVLAALVASCLLAGVTSALGVAADTFSSQSQPGNALIVPFNEVDENFTFIQVKNGKAQQLTTHWTFWDEIGALLGDVSICLPALGSLTVSTADVVGRDKEGRPSGPRFDFTGQRGIAVVTAYETDSQCGVASSRDYVLVDDALNGRFDIFNSIFGTSSGANGIALGVSGDGSLTDLPDVVISATGNPDDGFLDVMTFNPETLDISSLWLLSLREGAGLYPGELGPSDYTVQLKVDFVDNFGLVTPLPNVSVRGIKFSSLIPGVGSVIPATVSLLSSGAVRFSNIRDDVGPVGFDVFVYALHSDFIGAFGGAYTVGRYPTLPADITGGARRLFRSALGGRS